MRVLIVKTTSLGDVIHTLPAVQDAYQAIPNIVFDWVVESGFSQVPSWHPAVNTVFKTNIRKWRKEILKPEHWREYANVKREIQAHHYDLIIDAQGLIKSAWIARWAKGKRVGFGKACIKEKIATLFYDQSVEVDRAAHAIERVRQLFSQALGYALPKQIDYGLSIEHKKPEQPTAILLHGTTWPTKHYPEQHWRELAQLMDAQGIVVLCAWGNPTEQARATAICAGLKNARVLPRMNMTELANLISQTSVAVAVDTGLAHLSAALNVPTVSMYGPTDPERTGTRGLHQIHLRSDLSCAPCFKMDCQISDMKGPLDPPCLGGMVPTYVMSQVLSLLRTAS